MSNPRPINAKSCSSRLLSFTSSSISTSTVTKKRCNPFDEEETTFVKPSSSSSSSPPPPSSKALSNAFTSSTKTTKSLLIPSSSSDGTNYVKTSPSKEWKPKDEAFSREKALKRIVSNPSHPSNPITSRSGQNAIDVVVSASTGHQARAYGPNSRTAAVYFQVRQEKLKVQAAGKTDDIFKGIRVYLDGYLGVGVTNLELKALVNSHGGSVSEYQNQHVTHILANKPLSGSKNHAFLNKKAGWRPQIVDPKWVVESVEKGKRLDVFRFLILDPCDQPRVASFFSSVKPQQEPEAKRPKLVASKSTSSSSSSSTSSGTVFSSSSSIGSRSRSVHSISSKSSISSSFSKSSAAKGGSRKDAIGLD